MLLEDEAMVGILLRLLANALIIFFVARMVRGIEIRGFATAIAVAVVLGLFNALLRPLLIFLTLPITVLTLGLFIFVLNALLFWLVSAVVPGFVVEGFFPALMGAFLVSLGSLLVSLLLPFSSPEGRL
jgi:putative membrane protein